MVIDTERVNAIKELFTYYEIISISQALDHLYAYDCPADDVDKHMVRLFDRVYMEMKDNGATGSN